MPDIDEDANYEVPPLDVDPNSSGMGDESRKRRFSVSAEPASEEKQPSAKFNRKVYPKSDDALARTSIVGVCGTASACYAAATGAQCSSSR